MPARSLYATVTGTTGIVNIDLLEGFKSFSRTCTIECNETTLDLGDSIVVDFGYDDNHDIVFTGIVKKIHKSRPNNLITITCFDELAKASDYFMAAEDPENPFTRTNIDARDLVEDLLLEASITSFVADPVGFIFTEPSFNLVSVADAINAINGIIAWHIWCDSDGVVHFADRRPYVVLGDTSTHTFTTGSAGNIVTNEYTRSEEDLRNKVVVYGFESIYAEASAVSPYLPAGFYKTAILASPLITSQVQAELAADFNLELYNRLTRTVSCEALGDPSCHVNDIVTITEAHTGVSGDWFLYSISHAWGETGYTMRMVLKA